MTSGELFILQKELQDKNANLKIKKHQTQGMITTLNQFIEKNELALSLAMVKLRENLDSDLVDLLQIKSIKENIENVSSILEVQKFKKSEYVSQINQVDLEISINKKDLILIEELIQDNKCQILEFKK